MNCVTCGTSENLVLVKGRWQCKNCVGLPSRKEIERRAARIRASREAAARTLSFPYGAFLPSGQSELVKTKSWQLSQG